VREKKLIMEMKERLRSNCPCTNTGSVRKLDGKVTVWIDIVPKYGFDDGEETMDYRVWIRE
jgi:hypothetical protein